MKSVPLKFITLNFAYQKVFKYPINLPSVFTFQIHPMWYVWSVFKSIHTCIYCYRTWLTLTCTNYNNAFSCHKPVNVSDVLLMVREKVNEGWIHAPFPFCPRKTHTEKSAMNYITWYSSSQYISVSSMSRIDVLIILFNVFLQPCINIHVDSDPADIMSRGVTCIGKLSDKKRLKKGL